MLAIYSQVWSLPRNVTVKSSDTPLEKTDLSLSQWISIANGFLGVSLCVHFPLSVLDGICLIWTITGLLYSVIIPVSSYAYQYCCVWKILFSPPPFLSIFSAFPSLLISEPWREGFDKDMPLKTECSTLISSMSVLITF